MKSVARPLDRRPRGFALIITIVLVAFLVLILVGLATFTRVETQVADNSQQLAKARQNALFALNLAVGQLQKHTGPDQRVTATADLQPLATLASVSTTPPAYPSTDPASGVNLSGTTAATTAAINTYWNGNASGVRNRRWTGAWADANVNVLDSDNPHENNAVAGLQSWLVSGNESSPTGDAFKPTDLVAGLSLTSSPLDRLGTAAKPYRLLVKASAGVASPAEATDPYELSRAVAVPEMALRAVAPGVPTDPADPSQPPVVGHYAWWAGDEGVKARANIVDAHATAPAGETNAERVIRETARRQAAQRPAIEAMTTNDVNGLASDYPANSPELSRILGVEQLPFLKPAATAFPKELKIRYHDLSIHSQGVLSDTKHGGLKADLTYLFAQPDLTSFRNALRALYGTNDIAPRTPDESNPASLANPILNPTASRLATFPITVADGGAAYSSNEQFPYTASWEQLWSFANQASSFNASNQAASRSQTGTRHGLYPVVVQTKLFYRMRIDGGAPDPDGVNRSGVLCVDTMPLVVLANPYAVALAPADYEVRISGGNPRIGFGSSDEYGAGTPSPDDHFGNTLAYDPPSTGPVYAANLTYVLRSTGMAPGEAQIFTIDPDNQPAGTTIDSNDRIRVANNTDNKRVYMKNDFDPTPALTYQTDKRIPAKTNKVIPGSPLDAPEYYRATHAALLLNRGGLITILYQGYTPGDTQGYLKLLQFFSAQPLSQDSEYAGTDTYMFVVDPMSDGIRQGGGVNSVVNQPPTADNPAATASTSSTLFSHYQAPFIQVNYRANQVTWIGSAGNNRHPLEWARRFTKNGSTGSPGTTPNPWFGANLLRPNGSSKTVRWGIVNIGEGLNQTVAPASIGGTSASDVGFYNFLYDVPRPGQTLSSLGQLAHFNTTGYYPRTTTPNEFSSISSWQSNYALSNSYPQPRVPRDKVFYYRHNAANGSWYYHFDGSSIWNDILWDRFTFSTYPQSGQVAFPGQKLVNGRYRPFRSDTWENEAEFRGGVRSAANSLLVEGAFNINSTSVEAWKALFSSLKGIAVGSESSSRAPFSRTLNPTAGAADSETGIVPNSWTGFRDLSVSEVEALAEEMVMQVRKRGPFLSLADFVNRKIIASGNDTFDLGLSGALQAALDEAVNKNRVAAKFRKTSSNTGDPRAVSFADNEYILPTAMTGFPGHVLQSDVLSPLGSSLSARSDTFTIRTYGDCVNPATGDVTGRAWCEAVVQRLPDYVDSGTAATDLPAAGSVNETFGRRYRVVSFRWLGPEDI